MSVEQEESSLNECLDWLRCPVCGSTDCHIDQDPELIYFFCEEDDCDMYSYFEIANWGAI